MIIKSLSRKAGGSGQLFDYIFRYMLDPEKADKITPRLEPLVIEAKKYASAKEFEKALQKNGILQYHGTHIDFTGMPNTHSRSYGNLGNGFYLSHDLGSAKKFAKQNGIVKRYAIDSKVRFFDAGKRNAEYLKLSKQISAKNINIGTVNELHDKIREHLERAGYSGIRATKQTVIFKENATTELPKDFYKQAVASKAKTSDIRQAQLIIRHNVHSRTIAGYKKEFERNEALRIHKRKDSVQVYHTILSFSNKDKEYVTEAVLKDIAHKFIELYGKDKLYIITSHHDHDHIHLHCAISGTRLNGLSSRVDRKFYANLKMELDRYQLAKYPQLSNSLPRHGKIKEEKNIEVEKNKIRDERNLDKTLLLQVLETTYNKSTSREHFFTQLKALGHISYYRNGDFAGIKYNSEKKFRISRLGFDEKKLSQLDIKAKEQNQLSALQELRTNKNRFQELHKNLQPEMKDTEPKNNRLLELQKLRNSANKKELATDRHIGIERQHDRSEPGKVPGNETTNDTDSSGEA